VRLTNLRTGDGDVLINNPPFKDVAELKRSPDLTVNEVLGLGWRYIYLNVEQEPFNNPAVRRAFSYAIDRELLRRVVFFENGRALDTPVPEVIPWAHDKDTHPYLKRDLAKARQELSAAGKSGGVSFTLQTRNNSAEWQQSAELIKDQLKEIGLNMEITPIDFSTLLANGRAGNFQALDLGWSGDVDPDNISSIYLTGAGFNYGRYSSPEMDKFLSDGRMAQERSRRGEIYKQAQKLLFQDQPNIVYYNQPQLAVMRKSVQNYPNNYNGYWGSRDFDKIWKTGGR
jgi:peptide/nickel transport system substrate-binding protein